MKAMSKSFSRISRLIIATVIVPGAALFAQTPSAVRPLTNAVAAPTQASVIYVIRGARVVPVSGPEIAKGVVVIRDGRIESVSPEGGAPAPAGAETIEAGGLTVYPGMIDAGTSLGLAEISSVAATLDVAEVGELNPHAQAFYGINPHSSHVDVTRVGGVTSVASLPLGGLIAGQAAFLNLDGSTPREMALVPAAALVINFPTTAAPLSFPAQAAPNLTEQIATRDRQVELLRKTLRDALAYGRAVEAAARDKSLPRPVESVVLSALVPYARGERLVFMRANREAEIRAAVRFAEEMNLPRVVIIGGNDAWKVANLLRERNVSVVLTGVLDLPAHEDDHYDTLYENAARLQRAGVRFCISTGDTGAHVRDLPYQAGMAAAFGLPRDEALKSVTLYPAQIMNVADRLGAIEPGKVANLVIADGDLLEARTRVRHLFINGRQIQLSSRHTELYQQFKNRR